MTDKKPETPVLDLTADGVEFAAWSTIVENDTLHLGRLSFELQSPLATYDKNGLSYSLPSLFPKKDAELEVTFVSVEKESVIQFAFIDVIAFRVLDENGLLDLWSASNEKPRPAQSTFCARGHAWAKESFLVFWGEDSRPRFSYFVATNDWCLEVVSYTEPRVECLGPASIEGNR